MHVSDEGMNIVYFEMETESPALAVFSQTGQMSCKHAKLQKRYL